MERNTVFFVLILFIFGPKLLKANKIWRTNDDLDNHISPEDLREFLKWTSRTNAPDYDDVDEYASVEDTTTVLPVPDVVDCFGLGRVTRQFLNMRPDSVADVNTHYYFSSRLHPERVQVYAGSQFGLEWVDFNPNRRTVLIVHGFMSYSNASWVLDMTRAFLDWADVNVIAADWSGGGNTLKYWRAVANTRRVGSDITGFMKQLLKETGARVKDFHFVGHSLGAHIVSYVSYHIGTVARITGLDPAQPCFRTSNRVERLDETDADFVDVIHTNGRLLRNIGFGLPDPIGHADFYPNGGMKQPGCANNTGSSIWSRFLPIARLQQAICSHGRAYLLFTESLINNNCTFRAHQWNLTYEGVNASLLASCSRLLSPCSVMGIRAVGGLGLRQANGAYFVLTSEKQPYCGPTIVSTAFGGLSQGVDGNATTFRLLFYLEKIILYQNDLFKFDIRHPLPDLLHDLLRGFRIDRSKKAPLGVTPAYADPELMDDDVRTTTAPTTTTAKSWFRNFFGIG